MKVKIGDKTLTLKDGPIMIILTDEAKEHIANMLEGDYRYAAAEDGTFDSQKEFEAWMKDHE